MMYEKIVQIALLYDFYGQLLTDKQRNIIDMHYNNDLALSEISEQLGISRQGVYDSMKRAEKALNELEDKLGLVKRFLQKNDKIEIIKTKLDEALQKDEKDNKTLRNSILEIRKYIDGLI